MKLIDLNDENYVFFLPSIERFQSKRFPSGESFLKVESKLYLTQYSKYRVFIVIDENYQNEIVAFFALEAATVFWGTNTQYPIPNPCIELSYFSLNDKYSIENSHGTNLGHAIFLKYIKSVISNIAEFTGVKHIILFALPIPKVIDAYKRMGFHLMDNDIAEYIRYYSVKDCKLMVYNLKTIED